MSQEKFIIALEIGSSKAKIGVAGYHPDKDDRVTVYKIVSAPTVDSVRYGRINNIREVTETVKSLLKQIEGKKPIEGRDIIGLFINIGGLSLKSVKIKADIVLPERREITESMLQRLEADAESQLATDDELLCVEPIRFTVDDMQTPRPVGAMGSRLTGEYTAILCRPSNKNDIFEVVANRLKKDICGLSVRPTALAHSVLKPQETKSGCMLVDIGAETTTVAIFKNYGLQYLATIPLGSRLITRDLSTVLSITEEEAEALKLKSANAIPDKTESAGENPLQDNINAIVSARLADIVANIAAQPEFAGVGNLAVPAGIILTGGGSSMPNFDCLLASQTRLKVRKAALPDKIEMKDADFDADTDLALATLLYDAAIWAQADPNNNCVTDLQPADDPEVLIDLTRREQSTKPEHKAKTEHHDTLGGTDFGAFEPRHNDYPRDNRPVDLDDDDTLLDDDDVPVPSRKNTKKQKEHNKNDDTKGDNPVKGMSRIDKMINRLAGILTGDSEDDSADM